MASSVSYWMSWWENGEKGLGSGETVEIELVDRSIYGVVFFGEIVTHQWDTVCQRS